MYAAGDAGYDPGIRISDDHGAHWYAPTAASPDGYPGWVNGLAVHPASGVVLAAGWGMQASADGGLTWSDVAAFANYGSETLPGPASLGDVVFDAVEPDVVYAHVYRWGPAGNGLYRSADGGTTWANVHPTDAEIVRLAVGPERGTLYVSTWTPADPYSGTGTLERSTDLGVTWSPVLSLDDAWIVAVAYDPAAPSRQYALANDGVNGLLWSSDDGGLTWRRAGTVPALHGTLMVDAGFVFEAAPLAIDPSSRSLLVGTATGIFASADGGETFAYASEEIRARGDLTPLVEATVPGHAYASGYAAGRIALFHTEDGGASWSRIYDADRLSVAVDPETPGVVYVLASQSGDGEFSLWKSADHGATWTSLPAPPAGVQLQRIWHDPSTTGVLYAAYVYLECNPVHGVLKSTDGGLTWSWQGQNCTFGPDEPQPPDRPWIRSLAFEPAHPGTLVGEGPGPGEGPGTEYDTPSVLFRSTDDGATWTMLAPPPVYSPGELIDSFTITTSGVIFAGFANWIARSTDGGLSWEIVRRGLTAAAMVADPADPLAVYVAGTAIETGGATFLKTADGGATWTEARAGLPASDGFFHGATSIALDPASPGTFYVGTFSGLYKTTTAGE